MSNGLLFPVLKHDTHTHIIEHYSLHNKALNDYVYMEIRKGMYGLPQAGILANKLLKKCLARHGYFKQPHTPGLWKHNSRPVWIKLAVDDFRIKYIGEEDLQHLYDAPWKETYKIVEDRLGDLYCSINLKWNYQTLRQPRHVQICDETNDSLCSSRASQTTTLSLLSQSHLVR